MTAGGSVQTGTDRLIGSNTARNDKPLLAIGLEHAQCPVGALGQAIGDGRLITGAEVAPVLL